MTIENQTSNDQWYEPQTIVLRTNSLAAYNIRLKEINFDNMDFKWNNETTLSEIQELLKEFPMKHQLNFYDNFYEQISDPGAYVTVQKLKDSSFAYRLGNHGWHSELTAITKNELADYIYKNRDFNEGKFAIEPFDKWTNPARLKKRKITLLLEKIASYLK